MEKARQLSGSDNVVSPPPEKAGEFLCCPVKFFRIRRNFLLTRGTGCVTLTVQIQLIQLIQLIQVKQTEEADRKGGTDHVWNADFYDGCDVDHVLRGCGGHAGAVVKAEMSADMVERRREMSLFAMGLFAIIGAAAALVIAVVIASRR